MEMESPDSEELLECDVERNDCPHAAHLTRVDTDRELLLEAEGHSGGGNSALWEMLVQVAAGMAYLHSKGILHRDLKLVVMPAECVHFPHRECMDFDFVWWRFSPSSCLFGGCLRGILPCITLAMYVSRLLRCPLISA